MFFNFISKIFNINANINQKLSNNHKYKHVIINQIAIVTSSNVVTNILKLLIIFNNATLLILF